MPLASVGALLNVSVVTSDDVATVFLAGEFDVAGAPALRAVVKDLLAAGRRHILINLDGVTFMDGAAIGELIASDVRIRHVDGSLRLTSHVCCERLLQLTGESGRLQIAVRPDSPVPTLHAHHSVH